MASDAVDPDSSLLTYDQAAALLRVPRGTLYAWVHRKRVPFLRLTSKVVRFRRSDLEAWLRSCAVAVSEADENER